MTEMYVRDDSDSYRVIDRWAGGVGWLAHPDEDGRRASHAVVAPDGLWVIDPLDAPGVDDLLAEFGTVTGVAVLSDYHARDADAFARRHDVPVTVPTWLERVPDRIDAPVERAGGSVASFDLRTVRPLRAWRECVAYRPTDGTLYVPDYLSPHDTFTLDGERLALPTFSRLFPPQDVFADLDPDRIIFGHGEGISEGASDALAGALDGARGRFPRALVRNLPGELRAMVGALRD